MIASAQAALTPLPGRVAVSPDARSTLVDAGVGVETARLRLKSERQRSLVAVIVSDDDGRYLDEAVLTDVSSGSCLSTD